VGLEELCSKHSRLLIREAEDFFLYRFIYPRILQAAASAGLRIPASEVESILSKARSRKEANEAMALYIIGLFEKQLELLAQVDLYKGIASDALAMRAVSLIKSLLGGRELKYEDALEFAKGCGLEKTYLLLTSFPNVSKQLIDFLNRFQAQR
jgi:hypothetical protein